MDRVEKVAPDTGFELLTIHITKFYKLLQYLLQTPIYRTVYIV